MKQYYDPSEQMCIPCSSAKQLYEERGNMYNPYTYGAYADDTYDEEVNELCENLYAVSARCDKHYRSYSNKYKQQANQDVAAIDNLACDFIDAVVMGSYDEMGFLNLNNTDYNPSVKSGFLSNSMYYEEYFRQVSPFQIFMLVFSVAACVILGLWVVSLHKSFNKKGIWQPRRGKKQHTNSDAHDLERKDSGIELARNTGSYFAWGDFDPTHRI